MVYVCMYVHENNRLQAPVLKKGFFIEDTFGQLMLTHLQTLHRKKVCACACASPFIDQDHHARYLNTPEPQHHPIRYASVTQHTEHTHPNQSNQGLAAANAVHERRYGAYTLVVPLHPDSDPETTTTTAPTAAAAAAVSDAAALRGRALAANQGQGLIYEGPRWVAGQGEIVEEEVVAHLDGRDYLTRAQLTAKGLEPWARKVCWCDCVIVMVSVIDG